MDMQGQTTYLVCYRVQYILNLDIVLHLTPGGGGVLSGKVGMGMCGPNRVPFRPLRLYRWPLFYLKNGLDKVAFFKMLHFR